MTRERLNIPFLGSDFSLPTAGPGHSTGGNFGRKDTLLSSLEKPRKLKRVFDPGKRGEEEPLDGARKLSDAQAEQGSGVPIQVRNITALPRPVPVQPAKEPFEAEMERKKSEDVKNFSVTLLVNEVEKNKIVDMLHKAKSIISKKVEKVMGKKPKSGISNVDALQTVLNDWVDRVESQEREEEAEEEELIIEQVHS